MASDTVVSNTIGGVGLDGARPPNNTILYEGQKVPITIETSGLQGGGYTQVEFYVAVDDELKPLPNPDAVSGIAVHPDSSPLVPQPVTTDSDYDIQTVIMGKSGDDATWNVKISGPQQSDLNFKPNIHYQTKSANIDTFWSHQLLPAGDETTPNLTNSFHVQSYQVKDGDMPLARKFSALIRLKAGSAQKDLTDLYFFDKNKTPLQLTTDKKSIWIDSDDTGVLDFYITSHLIPTTLNQHPWALVKLYISVGTAEVDLPELIFLNLGDAPPDAQTSAPQVDGVQGGTYEVNLNQPIGVIVPSQAATSGNIQFGDTLFLIVNNILLPGSGTERVFDTNDQNVVKANQPFFYISPSQLKYSSDQKGEKNTMSYLILRNATQPVTSSILTFNAIGSGTPQYPNPSYPPGPIEYPNTLEIEGFDPGDTISVDDAKNGLTAKIDWTSWQAEGVAPPNPGDKFTILGFITGYDRFHVRKLPILQVQTAGVTQDQIDNIGYIETPIPPGDLLGWGRGEENEKSTIVFQYLVESTNSYSPATDPYILATLPAGGV